MRHKEDLDNGDSMSKELEQAMGELAVLRERLNKNERELEVLRAANARLRKEGKVRRDEFERACRDLLSLEQLKSDFLALVSHELRTPLTAVLGYIDLVLRGLGGDLTSKQEHYLRTSLVSAKELLGLINNMIESSSLESGMEIPHVTVVSLPEVVESALSPLVPVAVEAGLQTINRVTGDLPPVMADALKLRRALECLISNAIKFTPSGGTIILEAELVDDHVKLSVADSGIGMPSEEIDRIWEKFYQIDSSPTRRFGGLGLGLSIAKRLVEAQGGRIWVQSAGANRGSTFTIELRLHRDKARA